MLALLFACAPASESARVPHSGDGPRNHNGAPDDSGSPDSGDTGAGSDPGAAEDCPEGVTCIDSWPWSGSGNTANSSLSDFDSYGCAPSTDESGPEQLYRLTVKSPGFLAVAVGERGDDIDVHLLSALDSGDCLDRGNLTAGALLEPGTYWVVADSWVNSSGESQEGAYDLWINLTAEDDYASEGLDPEVLGHGLTAFANAWKNGDTDRFEYTIIDFSLPSTAPRQWTIDLADASVLHSLLVSHGEGSGSDSDPRYADKFSNTDGSHMSSLGMMVTASRFQGEHGTSLTLQGLEPGINDAVESRAIIVHGADYATQDFVDEYGYLGRSWGCPAVDPTEVEGLIDDVEEGSLYWSWYPDAAFLGDSDYL